jgi:surfeit locus 1 family protein
MTSERTDRFPIGLTIAAAIAMAILIGLGAWQLKRLAWKEGLLAQIAERTQAAPVALAQGLAAAKDPEFTRVFADCPGLASARFVEVYAIRDGQAGSRLVSLCRPADGPSVLVDRGFVPDTVSARPSQAGDTGVVRVSGLLRRGDKPGPFTPVPQGGRFFSRDIAGIGKALGAGPDLAPLILGAETSSNPEWKALDPTPLPAEIPNRHLEYALTWFGLAVTLAAIYGAMLLRRQKAPAKA